MKKLFLAAAGLFLAASAQADTPPATTTAPATPVMTTGTYVSTAPARRGLFGRFRNRTAPAPVVTSTTPMTTTTPAAPATTTPTPMPMGKVSSSTPSTGVVQTSGTTTTPMATTTTTSSTTMPMMTPTSSTRPMRMGMFARMRYNR